MPKAYRRQATTIARQASPYREHWLLPSTPYASYKAYQGAARPSALDVARGMSSDAIVEAIQRSGLRGRGGAGFRTGTKWAGLAKHPCTTRYVVCNGAEGEPGTFKDRYLFRHNPYVVLEGVLIAAHAIGAKGAYVALKASFRPEIERLRRAFDEMKRAGVVGSVPVTFFEGPDEYLFGEEKALLNVIEGEGPLPREADDPPYEHGLFATATSPNPALVNNAQTLALVPGILRAGAESFRALGTADTAGTLIVTLSGDLMRPGVYEIEAGMTLRALFHDLGGGPRPGRTLRAAASGVSAGLISAEQFDARVEFGALAALGAGLGSAGFMVFDDRASLPRVAQAVTRFLYVESCNQCSACKTELRAASQAFDAMFEGSTATPDLLERALIAAQHAPQGNRCYLPVEASAFVTSIAHKFRDDFGPRILQGAEYLVPKIVDYDEAKHVFTYDTTQPRKEPNWTYPQPAPRSERPDGPTPHL